MDVVEGNNVANWAVELESTIDLERSGWDLNTLKPGDAVTIQGMLARDGSPQIWGNSVVLTASNKRVLEVSAAAKAALLPVANLPARATPRWPDGKPRLGPPPGEKGYWGRPSATFLVEEGVTVEANAHGLLRNIADASRSRRFSRGREACSSSGSGISSRTRCSSRMPPGRCVSSSSPRRAVHGGQDLRTYLPARGRRQPHLAFHLHGRASTEGRVDGQRRQPPTTAARGTWDGDTFVVDSRTFIDKFWFSSSGLPHTDLLHVVERFTRSDYNSLRYEVTIDDPGAYTRPWKASWTLQWVPDDLPTYYCQDNRP
jgi:hypothetical protein